MNDVFEIVPLNPLTFYFTLIMGILAIILPRKFAFVPILVVICYITLGQTMMIATLNFTMMRVTIFFGWIRLLLRGEITNFNLNSMDKLLLLWVVSNMTIYILLRQDIDAVINRLGFAYNTLGFYFLFRILVRDYEDILSIIKITALVIVPLGFAMIMEMITGRNIFSLFGGVPEFSMIRNGWVRSQGSFRSPIPAGIVGASLLPLFVSLIYQDGKAKLISLCGLLAAMAMTFTSHSSGPVIALFAGLTGLLTWPLRTQMRLIRWGVTGVLIMLHIVMNAPVWYLFARVSELIGGGGWHRSYLIDSAIAHLNEWWLLGTDYTAHWMPTGLEINPNASDITNQFIVEGIEGGLLTMVLFIVLIVQAFRYIGKGLALLSDQPFAIQFTLWSLGVSLFVHVISFFSVSYFDQIIVFWYLLLAMISLLALVIEDRESFLREQ